MMKIVHYAVVLGLICVASAFGVAGTFWISKDRIAARERAERAAARAAALGAAEETFTFKALNPGADEEEIVAEAHDASGDLVGYTAMGSAQGYGGPIKVMVGLDPSLERIIGVTVVSHRETPGLGSRIAETKSKVTWLDIIRGRAAEGGEEAVSEFLKQFVGLRTGDVRLGKGAVQAITGATISSRGVVSAVSDAVEKIRRAVKAKGPESR